MIEVKVAADSVSDAGKRITTVVATYPRMVHAELMTHRAFSRNSASSRAIPVRKSLKRPVSGPAVWLTNKSGMQGGEPLPWWPRVCCRLMWRLAASTCRWASWGMSKAGLHKQHANRPLDWCSPITVIITATEWENFFSQRCHPDAQPEMRLLAEAIRDAMAASTPVLIPNGDWHLPMVAGDEKLGCRHPRMVAVGRCARVSFLNHEGKSDPAADEDLAMRLAKASPPHWSPWEHVATPWLGRRGNLDGWCSWRTILENDTDALHRLRRGIIAFSET